MVCIEVHRQVVDKPFADMETASLQDSSLLSQSSANHSPWSFAAKSADGEANHHIRYRGDVLAGYGKTFLYLFRVVYFYIWNDLRLGRKPHFLRPGEVTSSAKIPRSLKTVAMRL